MEYIPEKACDSWSIAEAWLKIIFYLTVTATNSLSNLNEDYTRLRSLIIFVAPQDSVVRE